MVSAISSLINQAPALIYSRRKSTSVYTVSFAQFSITFLWLPNSFQLKKTSVSFNFESFNRRSGSEQNTIASREIKVFHSFYRVIFQSFSVDLYGLIKTKYTIYPFNFQWIYNVFQLNNYEIHSISRGKINISNLRIFI